MSDALKVDGHDDVERDTVDTGTIAWLLPEIVNAFDAATSALRGFRAGAAAVERANVDMGPLRIARSHLHQAHGALELSELAGVGKLTEAMEELLVVFEEDPTRCDAITLDAIVGGCRSVVEYLEDLQTDGHAQPLRLFPSYRELLTARKADRIHPADLFVVDLGIRPPREQGDGAVLDAAGLVHQRRSFERALLRYFRDDGDQSARVALERAVATIERSVNASAQPGQNQQRAFWSAARAFFEGLAHDGFVKASVQPTHLKRLAGRVNLQIRKLAEGSGAVAERLFTDTLFYVAIAEPVTPHLQEVQARYRLADAVPKDYETQRYGRIDAATLAIAREALANAKAAWSAVVAGDVRRIGDFAQHSNALLDAVRGIKRRGLAQVAQVIEGIATELGFEPRQPPGNVALDVATALLFLEGALDHARSLDDAFDRRAELVVARVEDAALGRTGSEPIDWLDRMAREAEERLTVASFVAELQANLRGAEKVLDAFFRDPTQRADLAEAQKSLTQVSGALALLGHDDVHHAIDRAREVISRFQADDAVADPAQFESLAQSLGAVGFYVEQIKRERIESGTFHFDSASGQFSAALSRPHVAVEPVEDAPSPMHDDGHPSLPASTAGTASVADDRAFMATQIMEPETSLEDEIARRAADAGEAAERLHHDVDNDEAHTSLVAALEDVRRSAQLIDDRGLQTEASDLLASLRSASPQRLEGLVDRVANVVVMANRSAGIAPPAAPAAPPAIVPAADNVAAVDAELLAVFLEEAGEVLDDASASMHVLDADPESITALTNLRRGFHTLKGSSRMVGLAAFGDAAWSIEDTLNGQLADQGAANSDLRSLIDYAIRYLSDWVRELNDDGASARIPDALIEAARAVRGKVRSTIVETTGEPATEVVVPQQQPNEIDVDLAKTQLLSHRSGEKIDEAQDALADHRAGVEDVASEPALEFGHLEEEGGDEGPAIDGVTALERLFPSHDKPDDDARDDETTEGHRDFIESDHTTPSIASHDAGLSSSNVVPFGPLHPEPAARADDVRAIGPLTLSLALFNIYLAEADELLRVLTQDFAEWRHELDRFVSENAMRAAHSLAGSSATVGLVPAHDLASAIEDVLMALWRAPTTLEENQVTRLQDAVESLRRMLHRFAAERMPEPDPVRVAALLALRREIGAIDPTASKVADELLFDPLDFGEEPAGDATIEPIAESADVDDTMPSIEADHAAPAIEQDDGFTTTPSSLEEAHVDERPPAIGGLEAIPDLSFSDDAAATHREASASQLVEAQTHDAVQPSIAARTDADANEDAHDAGHEGAEAAVDVTANEATDQDRVDVATAFIMEVDAPAATWRTTPLQRESAVRDDIDPELLEVFVAEGNEILPQVGTLFRNWQSAPANPAPSRMLLRLLHTLKGSARMAGAMRLGELVHDIETRIETAARLPEVPGALIDELLAAHDRSLELFDAVQHPEATAIAPTDAAKVEPGASETSSPPDDEEQAPMPRRSEGPVAATDAAATVAAATGATAPRETKQAVQSVRVASDTLDRLVNLAGEVSISRARIENEVQQIKGAMGDLAENVDRLRAQLREIELQAEFQMQSRKQSQQTAGAEGEKFDPLEFDRFTRFQELTRMMAESVNDVKTVQQNLQRSLDVAETDLASQRRMTRDLQQDLMQVRMVPFSSIAERLYRVARRSAKEVDKRVNLDIRGTTVDIDRGVLERMAGPFEHLLRNHIVHGIESREARRARGKDEIGELLIEVRQEGNEIVLTFSDDGAGLDHDRIRAKGRELGLIGDGGMSDAQAAELIFHPGFSTATQVTELAGRGIGMDVVRAEAQELGGRVSVDSEAGRGTRFTIRLPLTLAITQVVLVAVADRIYALPAVLVEEVQQMQVQPLADAYRAGHVEYDGAPIGLAYLGGLLGIDEAVPVAQRLSPVLILRSGSERIAVHVDEVVANQEVVVKNLGPQLARMIGIVGATVLGSGDIVLILNPVQLAHMAKAEPSREGAIPAALELAPVDEVVLQTLPTVMVVDDSLTVRRVTQRLLSREGYQVVLAKDGVDALEQMRDFLPDAMLVDIEMPRMDGFDLTRNIRADDRHRHIPIIMITSRTAEKHRQHAAELGVDAYLGKPYQEDELLELLARHVAARRGHPA